VNPPFLNPTSHFNLSTVLMLQINIPGALVAMRKVLQINPSDAKAREHLALLLTW
jgi:hypothetical protein